MYSLSISFRNLWEIIRDVFKLIYSKYLVQIMIKKIGNNFSYLVNKSINICLI